MLRHLPLVLAFIAAPAFAQDLATGAAVKAAISDNTVQGSMTSSGAYTEFYAADGTIKGKDYTAKWSIQADSMCFTYEGAAADCWQVKIAGDSVTWVKDGVDGGTGTILSGNPNKF
jgi:hypothetical protein